jgi:hypothetical protein
MQGSLLEILRSVPDHRRAEDKRFDLSTVLLSASPRQVNNCCGVAPCRRAICETTASGASDSSIARAFSSSNHRRRPPAPVITSMRRIAAPSGQAKDQV